MPLEEFILRINKHGVITVSLATFITTVVCSTAIWLKIDSYDRHMKNDFSTPEMSVWCLKNGFDPEQVKDIHLDYLNQLGL